MKLTMIRRDRASRAAMCAAPFIALVLTILSSLVLFAALGKAPGQALYSLLLEPFLSWYAFSEVLLKTAPLLLIGMVAFVREYPGAPPAGFSDPASALPVQIYQWTQRSDPAFVERASGAIIVLLVFLLVMNTTAILLRRRFERRW